MFNLCSLFVEEYFTWLWGSLLTKIVSRSRVKHVQWGQIPMVWLQATSLWLGLDTLLLGSIESLKKAKFPKMDDWKTRHYLKSVLFWCPHVEYTPVTLSFVTLLLREWGGQTCRSFTAPDTILDVFCLRLEQPVYSQNFSEYIPWWYNYIRIRDTLYVLFR